MTESEVGEPRGILNYRPGAEYLPLVRLAPSQPVGYFVEHYWIVSWDLRCAESQVAETLPHPSVHVVIEDAQAEVLGVMTGKFSRRIEGRGRVFGIKFRPGAFYPFLNAPISGITNRSLTLPQVFGPDAQALQEAIQREPEARRCADLAEEFVKARLPEPDPMLELARGVVETILTDRDITQVEQVAAAAGLSLRALQRLFRRYVGVTPKWVIQRYRLHEAAEQLANGGVSSLSDLAVRLGYFDQAHFIGDFKSVVGRTPGEYVKRLDKGGS